MVDIANIIPNRPLRTGWLEFKESANGEQYDSIAGTVTAPRIFDGPWIDRVNFIREILLGATADNNGNQLTEGGLGYPDFPDAIAVRASANKLLETGIGELGQIWHGKARVTIQYETQNFNSSNGQDPTGGGILYAEESGDSTTEMLIVSGNQVKVNGVANPKLLKSLFHKTITIRNYNIRFPLVISPLWDNISAAEGKINSSDFTVPSGFTALANTLRYDGISWAVKREILRGRIAWELSHKFAYNRDGWNMQWGIQDLNGVPTLILQNIRPTLYESHNFVTEPVFRNEAMSI